MEGQLSVWQYFFSLQERNFEREKKQTKRNQKLKNMSNRKNKMAEVNSNVSVNARTV